MPPATAAAASTALANLTTDRCLELYGMEREHLDLLKRTVAKGTSDDEFSLFIMTARSRGLDPFAKEIHAVVRNDRDSPTGKTMTIQTGIDGYRKIAQRTGEYDGQEGPWWCGDDRVWREVWVEEDPPAAAKVLVYRKGVSRPAVGVASYKSYVQTTRDGDPVSQWRKMPDGQLAKCAEALAIRKAFPNETSGVHVKEELDQADNEPSAMGKVPLTSVSPSNPIVAATAALETILRKTEPASDAVVDAEIVDEKAAPTSAPATAPFDMAAAKKAIEDAPTEAALRALGPSLYEMGATEAQAKDLRALGTARLAKIREAAAPPTSDPAPPDVGWAKFLADVESEIGENTIAWTEERLVDCWAALLHFAPDVAALEKQAGPWLAASNKRGGPIVLRVRTHLKDTYNKQRADLRDAAAAAAAAGGAS